MEQMKRQILKLVGFFGVIATGYHQLQVDPPESQFLAQKSATLTFINQNSLLESGLYDGVFRTLLDDLHEKLLCNEFGNVMSHFLN